MRTFKIKFSSWINYFLTFIIVIVAIGFIGTKLLPSKGSSIILAISALITLYFTTKITASVLTIWTITEREIHLKWVGQFLFHKRRPDLTINWDEIKAYQFWSGGKLFDRFKLVLKDGTVLRYWHDNLITKDDFDKFVNYFISRVELHNEKELAKTNE